MYSVLYLFNFVAKILYFFLKLLPVKNQISFFSRQSDSLPTDFRLLIDEIRSRDPEIIIKVICNRFSSLKDGAFRFSKNLFLSMLCLAQSKVCVLDSYWPAVSILKHKKCLTVIQLWHSMGKIKKTGYQSVGKKDGRDAKLAEIMRMHKNYDYIIAGGKAWNSCYCEAFDVPESRIRNYGLPRMDLLYKNMGRKDELVSKYSELKGKKIIFYAPTYRNHAIDSHKLLKKYFDDKEDYAFIYRLHPRQRENQTDKLQCAQYTDENTFTLILMCDYFITDYSSLALEAAILNKKTIYYLFDDERYTEENGCNIDLFKVMPDVSFRNKENVCDMIVKGNYPQSALEKYKKMFLPEEPGSSTSKITDLIMEHM